MYYGLKQGQITQNIDNRCFKTHSFGSPVFKDYKYRVISETYITSFSRFFLLSTNNVRMSEGTFCRVEVHIIHVSSEKPILSAPQFHLLTGNCTVLAIKIHFMVNLYEKSCQNRHSNLSVYNAHSVP